MVLPHFEQFAARLVGHVGSWTLPYWDWFVFLGWKILSASDLQDQEVK